MVLGLDLPSAAGSSDQFGVAAGRECLDLEPKKESVPVEVEPEGAVEPLRADNGAAAAAGVSLVTGASTVEGLHTANEDAAH